MFYIYKVVHQYEYAYVVLMLMNQQMKSYTFRIYMVVHKYEYVRVFRGQNNMKNNVDIIYTNTVYLLNAYEDVQLYNLYVQIYMNKYCNNIPLQFHLINSLNFEYLALNYQFSQNQTNVEIYLPIDEYSVNRIQVYVIFFGNIHNYLVTRNLIHSWFIILIRFTFILL